MRICGIGYVHYQRMASLHGKCLLKKVFLFHEDGSVHQGHWKLCAKGARNPENFV